MEAARIEAQLDPSLLPDSSCSVLWLVPGEDFAALSGPMRAVSEAAGMAAWGFLGAWEGSKILETKAVDRSELSRLSAQYIVGSTRMTADMFELPTRRSDWFWTCFAIGVRPHQICGVLIPPGAQASGGWKYAGLQLVLSAAARQARPGSSHRYTLHALEQAFLAETIAAGGIAVTRLRAELLRPGIALTSTATLIDRVSVAFAGAGAIEPLLVERSKHLSGSW